MNEWPSFHRQQVQKNEHILMFASLRTGNIELDLTRHFDDALRMASVLEESVFQSFRAADKKPAKRAPLFTDNPVAGPIRTDEHNWRSAVTGMGGEDLNHHILPVRLPAHIDVEQSISELLRLGIVKQLLSFCATHIAPFDNQHLRLQSVAISHQIGCGFRWVGSLRQPGRNSSNWHGVLLSDLRREASRGCAVRARSGEKSAVCTCGVSLLIWGQTNGVKA